MEREEGLAGRAGGEEDELGVVVGGFAVEVDEAPVAVELIYSACCFQMVQCSESVKSQDTYQLHLPFPRAWEVTPLPC